MYVVGVPFLYARFRCQSSFFIIYVLFYVGLCSLCVVAMVGEFTFFVGDVYCDGLGIYLICVFFVFFCVCHDGSYVCIFFAFIFDSLGICVCLCMSVTVRNVYVCNGFWAVTYLFGFVF